MVGISGIVEACWGDTFGWLALCHSSRITLHLWPFDSESLAHMVNDVLAILIRERGMVLPSKENLGMLGGHLYKEKGKERGSPTHT